MILKFHRTDRMGDALNRILQGMCKVIHRVDAPFISCGMVGRMGDTVKHRVSHVDIGRSHINLRTQCFRAVGEFACLHSFKQIQIFLHASVAIRAFLTGCGKGAAVFSHFLCAKLIHESLAFLNQLQRNLIIFIKIAGRIKKSVLPIEAKPFYVLLNGFYILHILFCGVGIIKTQVAFAAVQICQAKVQADGFCMTDMQVAIWFGRKSGVDFIQLSL